MIFDIEHNTFWLASWGEKPEVLAEAVAIAKAEVAKAPKLIPIWSHRYLPDIHPLQAIRSFLFIRLTLFTTATI